MSLKIQNHGGLAEYFILKLKVGYNLKDLVMCDDRKCMKLRHLFLITIISQLFSLQLYSQSQTRFLTVGSDTIPSIKKKLGPDVVVRKDGNGVSAIEVKATRVGDIQEIMHDEFKRCGGFGEHEDMDAAMFMTSDEIHMKGKNPPMFLVDYQINQQATIPDLLSKVSEEEILKVVVQLSAYINRYYLSPTGYESTRWIMNKWRYLTRGRSDVNVKLFHHTFTQPSVIATFEGESDEVIILGGHLDSIVSGSRGRAPGSDDNASGIATLTEIIRILAESEYKPDRTIVFIGYAAEEVGLRGSRDVAATYQSMGKNVVGVLQFDMTMFNGSATKINITNDNTSAAQNTFLGQLVDEYLGVTWGYHSCGYSCSDHASWFERGYAASNPFEARYLDANGAPVNELNTNIHTTRDTLQITNGVEHVTHFVRLGLAYTIEMDKD